MMNILSWIPDTQHTLTDTHSPTHTHQHTHTHTHTHTEILRDIIFTNLTQLYHKCQTYSLKKLLGWNVMADSVIIEDAKNCSWCSLLWRGLPEKVFKSKKVSWELSVTVPDT